MEPIFSIPYSHKEQTKQNTGTDYELQITVRIADYISWIAEYRSQIQIY